MTVHEIRTSWERPPLHANQRYTKRQERRIIAQTRRTAGWLVKVAKLGAHDHVTIGLLWQPRQRRGRDGGENLAPLLKACIDGAVDAGLVPDDIPEHVTRLSPELLPVGERPGGPGIWITITTGPRGPTARPVTSTEMDTEMDTADHAALRALPSQLGPGQTASDTPTLARDLNVGMLGLCGPTARSEALAALGRTGPGAEATESVP